jgi:hypothetical protein
MSRQENRTSLLLLAISAMLVASCMLPGKILSYLTNDSSKPYMEEDFDVYLETLNSGNYYALEELAPERYTELDYAKPGTLTFTATVPTDKPVLFSYAWCTSTEEILQQNFEHIDVKLYYNGERLGYDVVHVTSYAMFGGMFCGSFGVLISDWTPGEHQLKAVATFDQKINDGWSDFEAGDYVYEYNVTVGGQVNP